jgi:hypothetical protein
MDFRAAILNVAVCTIVGALTAAFTSAKWLAASLWVFAALFLNGSLALFEDAQPGGFDNPNEESTPSVAKGAGAARFWAQSLAVSVGAAALGLYVQFR